MAVHVSASVSANGHGISENIVGMTANKGPVTEKTVLDQIRSTEIGLAGPLLITKIGP